MLVYFHGCVNTNLGKGGLLYHPDTHTKPTLVAANVRGSLFFISRESDLRRVKVPLSSPDWTSSSYFVFPQGRAWCRGLGVSGLCREDPQKKEGSRVTPGRCKARMWPQSLIPDTQGALEHKWYHRVGPTLRQRCTLCTPVSIRYWLWTDSGEGLSSGVGVAAVLLKAILWTSGGTVSQYSQHLEGGVEEEAAAWQRVSEQGPVVWTASSQLCSVCAELPLLTSLINMYFYLLPRSLLPSFLSFFFFFFINVSSCYVRISGVFETNIRHGSLLKALPVSLEWHILP